MIPSAISVASALTVAATILLTLSPVKIGFGSMPIAVRTSRAVVNLLNSSMIDFRFSMSFFVLKVLKFVKILFFAGLSKTIPCFENICNTF